MSKGLVLKSTGSWYQVKDDEGTIVDCKMRGKFRMQGIKTTNPLAVGDIVDFTVDYKTEQGVITKIHKRRNYIIRKSINLSKQAHILAANVDQSILMVTLAQPKTYPEFIDRFLVAAEAYGISAKIIFNKIDLYDAEILAELDALTKVYTKIGYECFSVSATTGQGVDEIKTLLANKISAFAGHSGIGKSTLINSVQPGLNIRTGEISEVHLSGKHTTTFPEMFELDMGGYIIDTPGIKGFGMIDMKPEEVSHFFPEIFLKSDECQFNNCTHTHEPGCAVKQAVEDDGISATRYRSYLSIFKGDDDEKFRTPDYS